MARLFVNTDSTDIAWPNRHNAIPQRYTDAFTCAAWWWPTDQTITKYGTVFQRNEANTAAFNLWQRDANDGYGVFVKVGGGYSAGTQLFNMPVEEWLVMILSWQSGEVPIVSCYDASGAQQGTAQTTSSSTGTLDLAFGDGMQCGAGRPSPYIYSDVYAAGRIGPMAVWKESLAHADVVDYMRSRHRSDFPDPVFITSPGTLNERPRCSVPMPAGVLTGEPVVVSGPPYPELKLRDVSWTTRRRRVQAAVSAQTITQTALLSTGQFFSPTLSSLATITQDTTLSTGTFYNPTLTSAATITLDALLSTGAFYDPTVTPGAVTITQDATLSTGQFYDPTLTSVATITQDATLSTGAFYEPTLSSAATITLDALLSTGTFYDPTVSSSGGISLDALLSTGQIYEPTLTSVATITLDAVLSTGAFYEPTLSLNITVPQLSTGTFYDPTVTPGTVTITQDATLSTGTFYNPTLTNIATITQDAVLSTGTFYEPTLTPGAVTITLDSVLSTGTFYAPSVTGDEGGAPGGSVPSISIGA